MGYYELWHPQNNYYYSVKHGGFEAAAERSPGTYSKYNSIDDKVDDFHYFTTFIKFGLGRASYDASQEIRNNEISREEGVALVRKYDGEFPERFADGKQRKNIAYYPFGAGPRKCIGNNFAMYEMILAISEVIAKFKIEEKKAPIQITPLITLKPKNAFLNFTPR